MRNNFRKAITTQLSKRWTPQELIQWAAGSKYSYSDMNYIVAGLVFETATGRQLFDEVSKTPGVGKGLSLIYVSQ